MSKITDLDQNLVGGNNNTNLVGDTSITVEPLELKAKSVLQILKNFRGYILEHAVKGDTGSTGLSITGVSLTLTSSESTGNTYKMTCTLSDMSTINAGTFFVPKGDKGDTGDTGATGNGIVSIVKTGTSGLVDTYTITYTNGSTSIFTVKNGQDGSGTEIYIDGVAVSSVNFESDPQQQITDNANAIVGKQDKITDSNTLSADLVDDTNTNNKFVTATEKSTWNGKQNALTFDDAPTENSTNPVKSGGVYTSLGDKQDKSNYLELVTTIQISLTAGVVTNVGGMAGLTRKSYYGNKLSFNTSSREITIGAGVTKLKVYAKAQFYINSADTRARVETYINGVESSQNGANFGSEDIKTQYVRKLVQYMGIIDVAENDVITIKVSSSNSSSSNPDALQSNSVFIFEVVE